jgi:hypothetical protein
VGKGGEVLRLPRNFDRLYRTFLAPEVCSSAETASRASGSEFLVITLLQSRLSLTFEDYVT